MFRHENGILAPKARRCRVAAQAVVPAVSLLFPTPDRWRRGPPTGGSRSGWLRAPALGRNLRVDKGAARLATAPAAFGLLMTLRAMPVLSREVCAFRCGSSGEIRESKRRPRSRSPLAPRADRRGPEAGLYLPRAHSRGAALKHSPFIFVRRGRRCNDAGTVSDPLSRMRPVGRSHCASATTGKPLGARMLLSSRGRRVMSWAARSGQTCRPSQRLSAAPKARSRSRRPYGATALVQPTSTGRPGRARWLDEPPGSRRGSFAAPRRAPGAGTLADPQVKLGHVSGGCPRPSPRPRSPRRPVPPALGRRPMKERPRRAVAEAGMMRRRRVPK